MSGDELANKFAQAISRAFRKSVGHFDGRIFGSTNFDALGGDDQKHGLTREALAHTVTLEEALAVGRGAARAIRHQLNEVELAEVRARLTALEKAARR